MGSMVSGLADAVLGVVEGVGLSADTVARYRKCCGVVVKFCAQRDLGALSPSVVDDFVACQQERARCGEIGPNRRNALVKSARMMLEFQTTGASDWVKEHFPAAGANLWDALHTGRDRHRDPEPDLEAEP